MPATNTLQRTVTISSINVRNAPLTNVGGNANEPAFSIGDWVRQFMLAAPFAWRWNRKTTSFTTAAGTQDYSKQLTDFGWLEKATFLDATVTPNVVYQLTVELNLGEDVKQNQPTTIAARLDDVNGNIQFRLFPVPDKVYTVTVAYQVAAPIFTNLTDKWSPIPDYLSYLYNTGFLAKTYEYLQDPRFGETMLLFLRQVIAANEGLNESEVNIFLGRFVNTQRESLAAGNKTQFGNQGRGMF